jgi:adenylosuccinate synthase
VSEALIVCGLTYGDEGKGSFVDYFVRKRNIKYAVRFQGGPQAGHNVVSPTGEHHCFSQFGSCMLVPGTNTLLSGHMFIEPFSFIEEAKHLAEMGVSDCIERVIIDENCPVITPFNWILNRMFESQRGEQRHGSCGRGFGLTVEDTEIFKENAIYAKDLKEKKKLRDKMYFLWKYKLNIAENLGENESTLNFFNALKHLDLDFILKTYSDFCSKTKIVAQEDILKIIRNNSIVFEGAQGVLLDKDFGFFPHVTRSNTTFYNAFELLEKAGYDGEIKKIGIMRGYMTRHGAGPFVTEYEKLKLKPCHNSYNQWQGNFRLGWLDAVALKYALEALGGVDILAVTNLDRMAGLNKVKICTGYETDSQNSDFFEYDSENKINAIKLAALGQQDSQKRTLLLNNCRPIYNEIDGWKNTDDDSLFRYLEAIAQETGREVDIISLSDNCSGKIELNCIEVMTC